MGPPSYMLSVVDRSVVMRRIVVYLFLNNSFYDFLICYYNYASKFMPNYFKEFVTFINILMNFFFQIYMIMDA